MPKKGLHVAQVGSAFVEEQRRGRMPKRMCGNDRHPRTLAGEFDPSVERLVAKGSAVTARKDTNDLFRGTCVARREYSLNKSV